MSQAVALWYGHWPGHVSSSKAWFILVREDFTNQEWTGAPPFGRHSYRQLTVDICFPSEQQAFLMAQQFHDPENLLKEPQMKQIGFAVKYTTSPYAGKYWSRDKGVGGWIVSKVPWIFELEDEAKAAQTIKEEGLEKEVVPVFVEDT